MKKIILALAFGLLWVSTAQAKKAAQAEPAETPSPAAVSSSLYLGLGMGANVPLSGGNSDYSLGGGGSLLLGYKLDSTWAIQLDVDQWFWAGAGHSAYDLRLLPELRWTAGGDGLSPYALAGFGYDCLFNNPSGYNTAAAMAVIGVGIQTLLRPGAHLFLEARYNLMFYQDATPMDIPVLAGLTEDL